MKNITLSVYCDVPIRDVSTKLSLYQQREESLQKRALDSEQKFKWFYDCSGYMHN